MKHKNTLSRLLAFIKPYKKFLVLAIVSSAINIIFTLWTPILIGQAIDALVGKGKVNFSLLGVKLIWIAFSTAMTALFAWLVVRFSNKLSYNITRDLRNQLFEKYHHLPLSYIDSHSHGDLMARMIADIDLISDGLLQGFTNLFSGITTIIGTICFMLAINVRVGLLVIILTPISLIVSSLIAKNVYRFFQEQLKIRGELTGFTEEMIGNQKTVQAFSHEGENIDHFADINHRMYVSGVKSQFLGALVNPTTRFVNWIVYGSVCIFGAFTVLSGGMTVGNLSSFLTYANQYTKPFNDISNVITQLETALACADRVFSILDEDSIKEPEHPVIDENPRGSMHIDDLKFSYTPSQHLIENFSLHVHPGQTIAIVGPTGCGKTTLINLLMRFYDPVAGQINIDGINTMDMTRHDLRAMYGMVLQDSWLFKGTIKENIAFGSDHPTDAQIIQAAKNAHVHKFIMQLKDGYDSPVAEEGSNLSQGQRQLICIARIMLANPPMLILDEATSSIDTRTERQIQNVFDEMMQGRTAFIVAHRLSTIQKADQIVVMRDGHIVEQGTHESLLAKKGFYANLYYSQFDTSNA